MAAVPNSMKAWQYTAYGTPLQMVEVPVPAPGEGELLVKVHAASLNSLDYKIQKGDMKMFMPVKFPVTPGQDIAGVVVTVGKGVTGFAIGDSVAANTNKGGGLAQYAILEAKACGKILPGVSAADASGLLIAGLTALQGLRKLGISSYDGTYKGKLLVLNATGGVGTIVVQLAKLAGAHVVATAGSQNLNLLRSLGADEVYDYKSPEVKDLTFIKAQEYDAIYDAAPVVGIDKMVKGLKKGGGLLMLDIGIGTMLSGLYHQVTSLNKKKVINFMFPGSNEPDLTLLMQLVAGGKIKVVVDSTYPLANATDAWTKLSSNRAVGKIIVTQ